MPGPISYDVGWFVLWAFGEWGLQRGSKIRGAFHQNVIPPTAFVPQNGV